MITDQTNEMATLEKPATNSSLLEQTPVTAPDVYNRAAGDSCEANQEGHEWAAGSGHPILKCQEVSIGVFRWQDTGRVRS